MRQSFEEFRDEVYKRKDERVQNQKRVRKAVLAVCIPLVLCVGFLSLLPSMMTKSENDNAAPEHMHLQNSSLSDLALPDVSITMVIQKGNQEAFPDTEEQFLEIYELLPMEDGSDRVGGADNEGSEELQSTLTGLDVIRITLTDEDGDKTEYILRKQEKTITKNGEKLPLSVADFEKLWNLSESVF